MVTTAFSISFSGKTSRGLVRKQNEDVWAAKENLFILADGMGGHNAGEVASEMAVSALVDQFSSLEVEGKEQIVEHCKEAMRAVNRKVYEEGQSNPHWKGMGTTLTALLFAEKLVAVSHVGDSRAYRIREGELKQLTVDHTVINRMKGAKDAVLLKHVLTRAIGTQIKLKPQVQTFPVHVHDRYLLCSDGLTNHISDAEILKIICNGESIESTSQHFINLANERGGSDNITLILVEVQP